MATTANSFRTIDLDNVLVLDLTAAGQASVSYTFADKPDLQFLGAWNKTTGALNPAASTYVKATGVLTVACADTNNVLVAVRIVG